MSLTRDLRILYHLALSPIRGKTHAERLDNFYRGQAEDYDDFRARLLRGREELYAQLPTPEGGVWIEMGGGTGSNLDYLGDRIRSLGQVSIVDLSPSLLEIARKRIAERGWTHVQTVEADVTTFAPSAAADVITFSYSLTMIPDWFAAVDRAWQLLKPGGLLGVVDFYVARKYPAAENRKHSWLTRSFWPTWFAMDNVYPSADHIPYLQRRFQTQTLTEHFTRVPYLPFLQTPYYNFVGRKDGEVM